MRSLTFTLLCCSAFLFACDNSSDSTSKRSDDAAASFDSAMESAQDAASQAMDGTEAVVEEAVEAGKALSESTAEAADEAMESAKDSVDDAVASSRQATMTVAAKTADKISTLNTNSAEGEAVYNKHCVACHGSGVAGSPKLGDKAAWAPRIAQGRDVMLKHAIEGYQGSSGYMPAKGGFMNLSDDQVSAAVDYMAAQAK